MSNSVSGNNHDILGQSLVLVRQHKDQIIERMEVALRGAGGEGEAFGQSEVAAMLLVEQLTDQARNLVDKGGFAGLDGVLDEHRALQIDGRHYSRFADALVPVLTEVLGPRLPRDVTGAWCDTFWAMIHASMSQRELADA